MTDEELEKQVSEAEFRAWDSLSRYKFQMFGYWAGIWVHLNRFRDKPARNPFAGIVKAARAHQNDALEEMEKV